MKRGVAAAKAIDTILGRKAGPPTDVIGYYTTSVATTELTDAQLLDAFRGHSDASENGAHYRRDVSFGEDASGVSKRGAAQALSALRNLALGLYDLEQERQRPKAPSAKSRGRQMTFSAALALLRKGVPA